MEDLGDSTSYLQLRAGIPVFTADGNEIGAVEHVLADPDADIFDGIVIDVSAGPGGHRFADAPEVAALYERGVVLTLDATAAERLPEPSENPAVVETHPDDTAAGGGLESKLRRAWDYLSGRY